MNVYRRYSVFCQGWGRDESGQELERNCEIHVEFIEGKGRVFQAETLRLKEQWFWGSVSRLVVA